MKNYKVKVRYHIEYEAEIVVSAEDIKSGMDAAEQHAIKTGKGIFYQLNESPVAVYHIEIKNTSDV